MVQASPNKVGTRYNGGSRRYSCKPRPALLQRFCEIGRPAALPPRFRDINQPAALLLIRVPLGPERFLLRYAVVVGRVNCDSSCSKCSEKVLPTLSSKGFLYDWGYVLRSYIDGLVTSGGDH
jgi:hypothetical protein